MAFDRPKQRIPSMAKVAFLAVATIGAAPTDSALAQDREGFDNWEIAGEAIENMHWPFPRDPVPTPRDWETFGRNLHNIYRAARAGYEMHKARQEAAERWKRAPEQMKRQLEGLLERDRKDHEKFLAEQDKKLKKLKKEIDEIVREDKERVKLGEERAYHERKRKEREQAERERAEKARADKERADKKKADHKKPTHKKKIEDQKGDRNLMGKKKPDDKKKPKVPRKQGRPVQPSWEDVLTVDQCKLALDKKYGKAQPDFAPPTMEDMFPKKKTPPQRAEPETLPWWQRDILFPGKLPRPRRVQPDFAPPTIGDMLPKKRKPPPRAEPEVAGPGMEGWTVTKRPKWKLPKGGLSTLFDSTPLPCLPYDIVLKGPHGIEIIMSDTGLIVMRRSKESAGKDNIKPGKNQGRQAYDLLDGPSLIRTVMLNGRLVGMTYQIESNQPDAGRWNWVYLHDGKFINGVVDSAVKALKEIKSYAGLKAVTGPTVVSGQYDPAKLLPSEVKNLLPALPSVASPEVKFRFTSPSAPSPEVKFRFSTPSTQWPGVKAPFFTFGGGGR